MAGPTSFNPNIPSIARTYDYLLGGKDNYPVDREVGEIFIKRFPGAVQIATDNRGCLVRAVDFMATDLGVTQFIDLGSGLPTQGNTHEAVSQVAPDARVVYVDLDPMVLAHARALLSGTDATTVIQADLRDPAAVLGHPELRALIDCSQPAGLLMTAVLHFVADESDPWGLVAQYTSELAPGSYVALSHATADKLPPRAVQAMYDTYAHATEKIHLRPKGDFERLFDGLELMAPFDGADPGVTFVGKWGAEDPPAADSDGSRVLYCGVARRP